VTTANACVKDYGCKDSGRGDGDPDFYTGARAPGAGFLGGGWRLRRRENVFIVLAIYIPGYELIALS
jgi:hypothetical protein